MECLICAAKTTKFISCIYCESEACVKCVQTQLLQTSNCCFCSRVWTYDVVRQKMSRNFLTTKFKPNRKDEIFAREQEFFPRTQRVCELEMMTEELKTLYNMKLDSDNPNKTEEELLNYKFAVCSQIDSMIASGKYTGIPSESIIKEKTDVIKVCIACSGVMIRNKCTSCKVTVCSSCLLLKQENHECKPEDLASVTKMKEMSVQCPKCSIFIMKSEGCNDMWCIACHTGFNYRTKKIIDGKFHNPEYMDFISKQQRTQIVDTCGIIVNNLSYAESCFYSKINHFYDVFGRQLESKDFYSANLTHRKRYLQSTALDKKEVYLQKSLRIYKKIEFNFELAAIYRTLWDCGRNIILQNLARKEFGSLRDNLCQMINNDITELYKKYDYKPYSRHFISSQ